MRKSSKRQVVLCVDDEKIVLNSLQTLFLRKFSDEYNFEFAESAEEAFEIIQEIEADDNLELYAIVTDWLMPQVRGDEFLQQVQKKYNVRRTIMLSGQADKAAVERARKRAQLDYFIHKPWDETELITKLCA